MFGSFSVEVIVGELVVLLLGIYGLYAVQKYVLSEKLIASERKLRQRIASFEANYGEIKGNTPGIVSGALGDIGIEGLLDEFGIDPKIIQNPLVKGLINQYAPRLLDQLAKKTATDKGVADETFL